METLPPYLAPQSVEQPTGYPLPFRVYHTWVWRFMRGIIPVTWLSLFVSLMLGAWSHSGVVLVLQVPAIIFYPYAMWALGSTCLIVCSEGITYSASGSTLFAPWTALVRTERDTVMVQGGAWQHPRWRMVTRGAKAEISLCARGRSYWEPGLYEAINEFVPWLFQLADNPS